MLVAQNHPKGMFLTRMRFEFGPLSSGNENFFVCFCSFSGEKRRLACERCLFFVRHASNQDVSR